MKQAMDPRNACFVSAILGRDLLSGKERSRCCPLCNLCIFHLRLKHQAMLTLPHLAALRASASGVDPEDAGYYAQNGADGDRIRKVLANKDYSCCSCSNRFEPEEGRAFISRIFNVFGLNCKFSAQHAKPLWPIICPSGVGSKLPFRRWKTFVVSFGPWPNQRKTLCFGACNLGARRAGWMAGQAQLKGQNQAMSKCGLAGI